MTAHYVYRCYSSDGGLLYVGCTKGLAFRLHTHRTGSFWAPLVSKVKAQVFPTKDAARAAERQAIRTEGPRFNVMGRTPDVNWDSRTWDDYIRAVEYGSGSVQYRASRISRAKNLREAWERLRDSELLRKPSVSA